jgi:aryl-alcohol dehydrogenase-like predicted oxidoreductase
LRKVDVPSAASAHESGDAPRRVGRVYVEASVAESLRQLRLDHIDLLLLHETTPSEMELDAQAFLSSLLRSGTVRELGIGANAAHLLAHYRGEPPYTVLQYEAGRGPDVLGSFPTNRHYHHSALRDRGDLSAAEALAEAVRANPSGKVLFSTRSPARLRENLSRLV